MLTTATLALGSLLCGGGQAQPGAAPVAELVAGNNAFAFDLYGRLAAQTQSNVVFSPYSVSLALGMTYAGAAGNTAKEMERALHFSMPPADVHRAFASLLAREKAKFVPKFYELNVANALWPQKGYELKPAFVQLVREKYDAGMQELDFAAAREAARKTINQWVEERTKGKIVELLRPPHITDATRLVLTNAIHLKGPWLNPFPQEATLKAMFQMTPGKKVPVYMMSQSGKLRYAADDTLQVLDLPVGKGGVSMLIVLPRKVDGLAALEKSLTYERLENLRKQMKDTMLGVQLPRFKVQSDFDLVEPLSALGMPSAFGAGADFSGMASKGGLFVSAVVHKAFLDVQEKGIEAAAATAVVMTKSAPLTVFRADHPFLYVIRENSSGSILFMGRLKDPS